MLVLDTQLLVLLVVGTTSTKLIKKHKNTHQYDEDDFRLLEAMLGSQSVRLIPNVVTEASNLLRQHRRPERDDISCALKSLVQAAPEVYVASAMACEQEDYISLRIADSALIICSRDDILLTADAQLYYMARVRGMQAINFNHERERFGLL